MPRFRFSREKISIQAIGKRRFWMGLITGLITAFVLSLAFSYIREINRLFDWSTHLLILENDELRFFDFFFAAFSSTLGLSIAIWVWMGSSVHRRRKDRINKQQARSMTLLVFWVMLLVFTRIGYILVNIESLSYESREYLNFYEQFWIIFILIPIFVFAQSWFLVRLVYRSEKWIGLSLLSCITLTVLLQSITSVDKNKINNLYHSRFINEYQYIDERIKKANEDYGIEFNEETIETLKIWNNHASHSQVYKVRMSFSNDNVVSLDTIILQQILVRNCKGHQRYYHRQHENNWLYPMPYSVLNQIEKHDVNSNETKELFGVLKEQIILVNTPEIVGDDYKKFTETQIKRSIGANEMFLHIDHSLKWVREYLLEHEDYSELAQSLPEVIIRPSDDPPPPPPPLPPVEG